MPDLTISEELVQQMINQTIEQFVVDALTRLQQDPVWIAKIETLINQTIVQRTLAQINTIDIKSVIKNRVDENIDAHRKKLDEDYANRGIQDRAGQVELTAIDGHIVVENKLISKNLEILESAIVSDLSVTGSINVEGECWNDLSDIISKQTLDKLSEQWKEQLIGDVAKSITTKGIDFTNVSIDGSPLVSQGTLSSAIKNSNLEKLGTLKELHVSGDAHINNTVTVLDKRIGINTERPEMALSVWDEEVSLVAGRFKENVGYIGTSRLQNLTIGVNRDPAIEIDINGVTTIKKAKVGIHRIAFEPGAPGYSGTRGDIVFNSNPSVDAALAWQCLGGHKWKTINTIS